MAKFFSSMKSGLGKHKYVLGGAVIGGIFPTAVKGFFPGQWIIDTFAPTTTNTTILALGKNEVFFPTIVGLICLGGYGVAKKENWKNFLIGFGALSIITGLGHAFIPQYFPVGARAARAGVRLAPRRALGNLTPTGIPSAKVIS